MKKNIILLVMITIIFSCTLMIGKNKRDEFNVDDWNSICEERYKMIPSLTTQYDLIGMDRNDVLELLGTNGIYTNNDKVLEYYVAGGLGDSMFFGIYFDEQGYVVEYKTFES